MTDLDFAPDDDCDDEQANTEPRPDARNNTPEPKPEGPQVKERVRLHHAFGGTYTDFDNESDLLDFVKEATTVKQRRNPDGSVENVFSNNAHLVHGAAHPDYPNLRVEKVSEVTFPDEDE